MSSTERIQKLREEYEAARQDALAARRDDDPHGLELSHKRMSRIEREIRANREGA